MFMCASVSCRVRVCQVWFDKDTYLLHQQQRACAALSRSGMLAVVHCIKFKKHFRQWTCRSSQTFAFKPFGSCEARRHTIHPKKTPSTVDGWNREWVKIRPVSPVACCWRDACAAKANESGRKWREKNKENFRKTQKKLLFRAVVCHFCLKSIFITRCIKDAFTAFKPKDMNDDDWQNYHI